MFASQNLKHSLSRVIEHARVFGLSDTDLRNAETFLEHDEFGLCFETVVTQLYEYDVEIDITFASSAGKDAQHWKAGKCDGVDIAFLYCFPITVCLK